MRRFAPSPCALPWVLAASLGVAAPLAYSQTNQGILVGVAHDATGAVVPGATVSLRGEQTGQTRSAVTSQNGAYRFDALNPEQYTVTVTQAGFQNYTAQHVVVNPSVVSTQDITLSVGSTNQTVTVDAASTTLNTDNGQLAGTIQGSEIHTLPVFTQNPIELATTVPGVQIVNTANQLSNGVNFQVNGARPRSNNFLLDSQEINDVGIGGQAFQPQITDLYSDVTVITSDASAEFGRAGGGIVNLITRSGSNTVHGTVFERYTGSGLNAFGGLERGQPGAVKARFDEHSFGFTGGGPILKDKLFVFGGLEVQRFYGQAIPGTVQLPDAAGVATLKSLTGPAAAQVALLSPYLLNYSYLTDYTALNFAPVLIQVGQQPGCAANPCSVSTNTFERRPIASQNPDTQWSFRVDFTPRSADTFYYRYLHDRTSLNPDFFANPSGGLLGLDTQQGGPSELATGGWTHVFGPTLLNEFRASETRINFLFSPTAATSANPLQSMPTLEINGLTSPVAGGAFPLGPNQDFPQGRAQDLYQIQDTISWTRGHNSVRAGVDLGRQIEKDTIPQNQLGTAVFGGGATVVTSALQNFLNNTLGASGTITRSIGPLRADPHAWRNGIFAQDDLRVSADLVVNLGVRWDYTTNPENSLAYPAIDPNNPFAPINTVIPVKPDWNNVSPRIGFAWTPHTASRFANGTTVVRGGFGMFYDSFFSNFVTNAATDAPNSASGTIVGTTTDPVPNAIQQLNSFVPTIDPTSSVLSVANNLVNPLTYEYNLGIEHQLPGSVVMAVRYVGSHAEKLFASDRFNYFNGLTGQRLDPTRGVISLRDNSASSEYNSVIVEGTHAMRHGVLIRANYTFSKDLDNGSEIFGLADTGDAYPANLNPNGGRHQEWGPSAYDHRQYFSVAYAWNVPAVHVQSKLADTLVGAVLRDWTISGVEQFQSGPYSSFNVNGFDTNGDGDAFNDRPVLGNRAAPLGTAAIDGALVGGTAGTYYDVVQLNQTQNLVPINPSSVHFLVPYDPGNLLLNREIGRNSFMNPGTTVNNIAVEKGFGTGLLHFERGRLVLRGEVSNLANHNDRGYLDTNVTDFGADTSFVDYSKARTDPGRTMVLWARFVF